MRTFAVRRLSLLVLALLLAACGAAPGGSVVATVGDETISRSLLERMVRAQVAPEGSSLADMSAEERAQTVAPAQRQLLTALIQFEVLEQVADEQGVELDEDRVDEMFEQQVQQFGGEDAYQDATGLTEEEFRDLVVASEVRVEQIMGSLSEDPTEEDLRAAYEEREDQYTTRTVRHILVEDVDTAEQVIERIEGGEDFGEVAQDVSTDPGSAQQGGELPPAPRGQYVPEFDEAVWGAEIGELSGPVESQFGVHVFEVTDESEQSFEEVRDQLEQELGQGEAQSAFQGMVQSAFADLDIAVSGSFGQWDHMSGQVVAPERAGEPEAGGEGGTMGGQLPQGELPEGSGAGDTGGGAPAGDAPSDGADAQGSDPADGGQ